MNILLIGPQGSGKSTQGKLLSEFLNIPFVVTGDILREISSSDTDEGKRLKQIIESGNFADLYAKQGRFFELWEKQKL